MRPGLAAILIGDNPASEVYVRTKTRACAEVGVHSELHRFGADCPEREVVELIGRLNADPNIHGILVQLPLPPRLDAEAHSAECAFGQGRGRLQLEESRGHGGRPHAACAVHAAWA